MTSPARHLAIVPSPSPASASRWDESLACADAVTSVMALDVQQRQATGQQVPRALAEALTAMQAQVESAVNAMIDEAFGCADLLPGADSLVLTEAAFVGTPDTDVIAVLLPGSVSTFDAVTDAVEALRASPVTASLVDLHDTNLVADVSRPRWTVLHECSGSHSFHAEIASDGKDTPGAQLITRVEFLIP